MITLCRTGGVVGMKARIEFLSENLHVGLRALAMKTKLWMRTGPDVRLAIEQTAPAECPIRRQKDCSRSGRRRIERRYCSF